MSANQMNRRKFMGLLGMCAGGAMTFGMPKISFAQVPQRGRFVFVLLRGGLDGLAAVVPTSDPHFARTRGELAANPSDLIMLENGFALSPGLAPLAEFWRRNELAVIHAMAIPFRTRSHFDGQAVLELGIDRPQGASDGWLNRLLAVMGGSVSGIAVGAGMPLSMAGGVPVATWSPANLGEVDDAFLARLHLLYRSDPVLFDRFEAALGQREISQDLEAMASGGGGGRNNVEPLFRAAARFMAAEDGPNVAAMEMSGWDTHVNQGVVGGALDNHLGRLASGLAAYRDEIGSLWPGTTVVVMTEFGRAAKPNGSRGTDHGTAGAGFVLGTGIGRSRVVCDWPGIGDSELYEGRDLAPTTDTRAILKAALAGTFDMTAAQLNRVFPGSSEIRASEALMG